jgi:hypothetical protein
MPEKVSALPKKGQIILKFNHPLSLHVMDEWEGGERESHSNQRECLGKLICKKHQKYDARWCRNICG